MNLPEQLRSSVLVKTPIAVSATYAGVPSGVRAKTPPSSPAAEPPPPVPVLSVLLKPKLSPFAALRTWVVNLPKPVLNGSVMVVVAADAAVAEQQSTASHRLWRFELDLLLGSGIPAAQEAFSPRIFFSRPPGPPTT